jgi:hypothetical protein
MGPLKAWTPQEDERLRSLIVAGGRPAEIAVELRRTVPAVRWRASLLRLSFKRLRAKAK